MSNTNISGSVVVFYKVEQFAYFAFAFINIKFSSFIYKGNAGTVVATILQTL